MGNQSSKNITEESENIVLVNRGLTKFPYTPSPENMVRSLYLSGNNLSTIPKNMEHVIVVDLSNNQLGPSLPSQISEALASYPSLKSLYFTKNQLKDLNNFKNDSVQVIYLAQNRFDQLENHLLSNFPQLRTLYFDCNFLTVFSGQLNSLDLSKNHIKHLPNNFSKSFPKLHFLYLNDNFIEELPEIDETNSEDSVFPQTLTLIDLSNNLIEKVTKSITILPNLTELNIENNKIEKVPQLNSSIKIVRAGFNKINKIDDQQLNELKEFGIYNNELSNFPTEIKAEQNTAVIVDHNKITEIDFESIPINSVLSNQITTIDISFNGIEKVPKEIFESLPNLQSFSAYFNKITDIPSEIANCQTLFFLNISHNLLKKLPKLPLSLDRLTASNCQIESFDNPFGELFDLNLQSIHLKLVDLSGNKLTSFTSLPSIQILNLSQNHITKMPLITDNIRILDLSCNDLHSAPDSMPDSITGPSIVDLNLSYNKLTKMPQLHSFPLLQYLSIAGNPINGGFDITKFSFLERVDISQTDITLNGPIEKLNEIITSKRGEKIESNNKTAEKNSKSGHSKENEMAAVMKMPLFVNQQIEGDDRKSGYSEFLGLRNSMEDSIIVRDDINLYAVCDGHGGPNTAKFASIQIAELFEKEISLKKFEFENAKNFVGEIFHQAEQNIEKMSLEDGSTLCLAFVCKNEAGNRKIVTAHLGDARAMIVRNDGKARTLTKDHKPSNRGEFERVHKEFGRVTRDNRIDGVLSVARSLGDFNILAVGREPDLNEFEIDHNDRFLVICCDGVFDVLSNDNVASVAMNAKSTCEAAFNIRNAAFSALSCDNISAIVVDLTK